MTKLTAIAGDITTIAVDVIVNAANSRLAGGGGVDGAIHRAGGPTILEECRAWVIEHGPLPTGEAMTTGPGHLPSGKVIHTVGPIWADHDARSAAQLLANCYRNSLMLAAANECRSIAFPNISTGVYGYPKEPAAAIAVGESRMWVEENGGLDVVTFVCFDEENLGIYSGLLDS